MNKLQITSVFIIAIVSSFACKKTPPIDPLVPPIVTEIDSSLRSFSPSNTAKLDSILNALLIGNQIPGLVVGVRSQKFGTYKKAFGVSNYATKSPMKVDAIFDIGSVHKNYKWVLIHLLEKEGLLKLDDFVNKYVVEPSLPGVTIRHLMQHSSGLCDIADITEFNTNVWNNRTFENSYDTMMYYLKHANGSNSYGAFSLGRLANFSVGVNSSYSSFGPLIAGEIALKITGKNMRQLIREKIFIPLGLKSNSFLGYDPDPLLITVGHANFTTVSPFTNTAASTMGLSSANGAAIHTDVSDLLTFTHRQFTDTNFLSAKTVKAMKQEYLQGFGMKAGLGILQFTQWAPLNFWGHAGFGIRSHSSTMLHNEELKLTVVVMTNIYTPMDNQQTNFAISEAVYNALK